MAELYKEAKQKRIVLNKEEFAKALNYSRSHLHRLMNGEEDVSNDLIAAARALLYETKNVPRGNVVEEPETYLEKRNHKKTTGKRSVPLYDAPASAGITEAEMTAIAAPAGTIDVGDLLHDSQAAIRIYRNSMIPNYPPGCVVGLTPCRSKFIEPGEVYVIETRDRRLLKRLFYKDDDSESDFITCYSDNTMAFEGGARHGKAAYPPFNLPKSEIMKIFTVTGVLRSISFCGLCESYLKNWIAPTGIEPVTSGE